MTRTLFLAFLLAGCTALQPLSPDTTIGGERVVGRVIHLKAGFSYRPALQTAWFPAGNYLPDFEDEDNVYFRADKMIILQTIMTDRAIVTGGLALNKRGVPKLRSYLQLYGDLHMYEIPFDVPYMFINR